MEEKFESFRELLHRRCGQALPVFSYARGEERRSLSWSEFSAQLQEKEREYRSSRAASVLIAAETNEDTILSLFAHVLAGQDVILADPGLSEERFVQAALAVRAEAAEADEELTERLRPVLARESGRRRETEGRLIFFTSGTSERSKAVVLTSRALCLSAWNGQSMPSGTQIDLGGIGKGYASAQAKKALQDAGVTSAIVSLGGNISALGQKPDGSNWTVAIQDPADTSTYFGLLEVADKCVITSGGYQRYFEQDGKTYWHILDPATGYPADSGIISATVVSTDDVLSDGLSTALFVMGLDKAEALWRENTDAFDMILMTSDRNVYITSGISDDFSTDLSFEVVKPCGLPRRDLYRDAAARLCLSARPPRDLVAYSGRVHDAGAQTHKVCSAGCIACHKCEKSCEAGAITVAGNLASIDRVKCTGCGKCAEVCTTGAIAKADFSGAHRFEKQA